MTDIVVRLELQDAAEEAAFGDYLSRFMGGLADEIARLNDRLDAPFLMVRSEPWADRAMRVVTFQEPGAARDFARGWRLERAQPRPASA